MTESVAIITKSFDSKEVQVRVEFIRLGDIDTMNDKFNAEVRVTSRWIDDKTDFGEDRVFDKEKKFKYWHPNIFIENALTLHEEKSYKIEQLEKGLGSLVTETRIAKGYFWERIELNDFPIDIQELHITVASKLKPKEVEIVSDKIKHSKMHSEARFTFRDQQKFHLFR
jgi:hypothetical protein